ncbi:hypothetical protein [Acidihalobacter ferrooxydans]|uniref:Uncharacterized protein n=1 Tax=Acidihalobacter ferrooxydans TaxID=1765967 RepID=A0A1P8UFQ8_9GAMM|nr:hypothetical protein [Acidihalobacter ferrooxydans]APZ42639.1 hypothetical protein BW247_05610 [Acidihalobacter ferrooxydans]
MSPLIKPRKAEPGALRRWTRQSVELLSRRPALTLLTAASFALVALAPQSLLFPFVSFVEAGWLMSLARAADHSVPAYDVFRASLKDLFGYSRDIMLRVLMVILVVIAYKLAAGPGTGAVTSTASWPPVLNRLLAGITVDQFNSFAPVFLWGLFLSMLTGYAGFDLTMVTAVKALVMNLRAGSLLFAAGLLPSFLSDLVGALPVWAGAVGTILLLGYSMFLVVMGYVSAREIFEGQGENNPAKALERSAEEGKQGKKAALI